MEDIKDECVELTCVEPEQETTSVFGVASAMSEVMPLLLDRNEREMVVRFIEMVRCCPEIWDVSSVPYRNKLLRRRSFRRLAEELGWSADDVVKKYNNLRTYYTKEIIKEKKRPSYKSKWPYFDQLDSFMRKTVHVRLRPGWSLAMLNSRSADRQANHDGTQASSTLRKRRLVINASDARRNGYHVRSVAAPSAAATATTPTPLSLATSAPTISTTSSVPQANISHMPSLVVQHQHSHQTQSTHSQVQRQHVQQHQQQQQQQHQIQPRQQVAQQQQSLHQQKSQTKQQQQLVSPAAPKTSGDRQRQAQSSSTSMNPSKSSTVSSAQNESSDVIFSKLIASQLGKVKEGRNKEQLKISLMQQIVQAMFDEGDNSVL